MRTARAKGLSPARVVVHHGLRNALIPVVTVLGLQAGIFVSALLLIGVNLVVDLLYGEVNPRLRGGGK